ncbi:MAG TPA: hypothetical protein VGL56_14680 [Fimbriimonadaceae bacterium]
MKINLHERIGDIKGLETDLADSEKIPRALNTYDPTYPLLSVAMASGDSHFISLAAAHDLKANGAATSSAYFKLLFQHKRWGELEQNVLDSLRKDPVNANWDYKAQTLCDIYFAANRPQDVVKLLKEFPNWSQDDLSKLIRSEGRSGNLEEVTDEPIPYFAAWALSRTGNKRLAVRILRQIILQNNFSAPYLLLNEIGDA